MATRCAARVKRTSGERVRMAAKRRTCGQSLVEFALSLSLLLLILMAIFDLGRVFHSYIVITNAAREGAYYGAMHPEDHAGIIARAIAEAQNSGISLGSGQVTVSSSGESGTPMEVGVQFGFSLLTTYLLGAQNMQLQSWARMVIY